MGNETWKSQRYGLYKKRREHDATEIERVNLCHCAREQARALNFRDAAGGQVQPLGDVSVDNGRRAAGVDEKLYRVAVDLRGQDNEPARRLEVDRDFVN